MRLTQIAADLATPRRYAAQKAACGSSEEPRPQAGASWLFPVNVVEQEHQGPLSRDVEDELGDALEAGVGGEHPAAVGDGAAIAPLLRVALG